MASVDFQFEHMEGWLMKQHSTERKMSFARSTENRRWFKVSEVKGLDATECILGYYASQKVKEAKGFIYLQDVKAIETVGALGFTLHTPARNLSITCQTKPELKMWLEGLMKLCPEANIEKMTENIAIPPNRGSDTNNSSTATHPGRRDEAKTSDDEGKTNDDDGDNRLKVPEKSTTPDRKELKSMKYAAEDNEDDSGNERAKASKGGGKFEEGVDGQEKTLRQSSSRDREDHRISGFHPGAGSGATSRLHAHINNETAGESALKPPGKDLRSSKEIVPSSSSSLVRKTTKESNSSTRTSKTEWIEGSAVDLQLDEPRGPKNAEYYADGPDIDDLGNLEMAPEPDDDSSRAAALKENRRQPENYYGDSKGEEASTRPRKGKDAAKTLRKASDGLYGESQGKVKTRSSIDDLISSQQSLQGSQDHKGYDDDDDDDPFDLALEKKRLAEKKAQMGAKESGGEVVGRRDSKEVASLDIASAYRSRSSSVSGTPRSRSNSILEQHLLEREGRVSVPQPPADEKPPYAQKVSLTSPSGSLRGDAKGGIENKASDNVDRAPGKVMMQPSTAADVKMSSEQLAKYGIGQGVAADDNWLEDDFDN